ncbi:hypothetical protein BG000_002109 [Podila horticola]|nr:hypothetical protein BG000_002109 [Podila horticola]
MLKKKRFSGLFGAGLTDIPSPGPEQQQQTESAAHSVSRGFSPQMLSSQGRQSSMSTLSTTTGIMGGFGQNNKNDGDANSTRASDEANTLTRAEVHQSLENLKKLVIAAESYRELTSKLAKTTKQLGKCFKEYGDTKGMDSTYGKKQGEFMCLKSSANFYESFSEMESKLATCLQKDFEQLQNNWEKHSKRVTKDEKAHDEVLSDLDERIKKISLNYDKKSKKPDPNTALGSHEKYISTLAELQDSIAVAKRDHRNTVARREKYTHSLTSQIACRLSEAQFLAIERQLRGSGPSLVKIKEWAPYAGIDMPPPTLVTNGDPTIDIRAGTFEEYSARHPISQRDADQGRSSGIGLTSPQSPPVPVVTLTEMPQITLPPFAPMQQYLQQQQQQQQQYQQQDISTMQGPPNATFSPIPSQLPPTMSMPQPHPTSMPGSTLPTQLPTTMPEPQKYIPQPIPKAIVVASDNKPTPIPPTIVTTVDHKVLVTEPVDTPGKLVITQPTIVPAPKTIIKEIVLTTSPPNTPGAFPVTDPITVTASLELKAQGTGDRDGSFPEDQGSVITKVDSGGSTTDMIKERGEYLQEHVKGDDEVLEAYHQDDYVDRYGYPDERSDQYRDARRLDAERDDLDHSSDELYNDPYSPTSDRHQYYGDGDDMSRVEPRRYFDDDDSQHSGTISALQSREREYYGRSRYDDGQSDRSYQRYSSSPPPLGQRPRGMSGTGASLQSPVGDYRRDSRYPPRTSTPQSRAVATPSHAYEKNGRGGSNGKIGATGGTGARYSSDYEGSVSGGGYTRRRP